MRKVELHCLVAACCAAGILAGCGGGSSQSGSSGSAASSSSVTANGITIQDDLLEQDHFLRDKLASVRLNRGRRKIDLNRIPTICRKDFAIGTVDTGMGDVWSGA